MSFHLQQQNNYFTLGMWLGKKTRDFTLKTSKIQKNIYVNPFAIQLSPHLCKGEFRLNKLNAMRVDFILYDFGFFYSIILRLECQSS